MNETMEQDKKIELEKKMKLFARDIAKASNMTPEEIERGVKELIEESLKAIGKQISEETKPSEQIDLSKTLLEEIDKAGMDGIVVSELKSKIDMRGKDRNKRFAALLESLEEQNLIIRRRMNNKKEILWTKTNYDKWKAYKIQILLSEIEKSDVNGIRLSELNKKLGVKGKFLEELLRTLEERDLIIREYKGKSILFWSRDNYEKRKSLITQKPKKITTEDIYKMLIEFKAHVDQRLNEIRSILENIEKKH